MPHRTRIWVWVGRGFAVVIIGAVAVYLSSAGLDKADKIASGLSLLVALAALLAPYLLPTQEASARVGTGSQMMSDVVVGGRLAQLGRIKGGFRSSRVLRSASPSPTTESSASTATSSLGAGAQVIRGTWVGGDVTQVGHVDGDVTLE